jgi:hypothetical protein
MREMTASTFHQSLPGESGSSGPRSGSGLAASLDITTRAVNAAFQGLALVHFSGRQLDMSRFCH